MSNLQFCRRRFNIKRIQKILRFRNIPLLMVWTFAQPYSVIGLTLNEGDKKNTLSGDRRQKCVQAQSHLILSNAAQSNVNPSCSGIGEFEFRFIHMKCTLNFKTWQGQNKKYRSLIDYWIMPWIKSSRNRLSGTNQSLAVTSDFILSLYVSIAQTSCECCRISTKSSWFMLLLLHCISRSTGTQIIPLYIYSRRIDYYQIF